MRNLRPYSLNGLGIYFVVAILFSAGCATEKAADVVLITHATGSGDGVGETDNGGTEVGTIPG